MGGATFENTFGALLVGTLFACVLFGIVNVQAHHYFAHYPDDCVLYKLMVFVVWLAELAHTIGTAHVVYTHTIWRLSSPEAPITLPGIYVATLMGALITMMVQVYFSNRVYRALRRPLGLLGVFSGGLAAIRCVGAIVLVVKLFSANDYRGPLVEWGGLITGLLSVSAATDVIIAVAMLYYLFTQRDKSFKRVQQLIDRLILITIRSGLLTSITAVVVLVIFQVISYTFAWLAVYTCLAKLYTITFLSALNDREKLRQGISGYNVSAPIPTRAGPGGGSGLSPLSFKSTRSRPNLPNAPISIEMVTTTNVDIDGEDSDSPGSGDVSNDVSDLTQHQGLNVNRLAWRKI